MSDEDQADKPEFKSEVAQAILTITATAEVTKGPGCHHAPHAFHEGCAEGDG